MHLTIAQWAHRIPLLRSQREQSGHLLNSLFLPSNNLSYLSHFQLTFHIRGHSASDFCNSTPTTLSWPLLSPMCAGNRLKQINEIQSSVGGKAADTAGLLTRLDTKTIWKWTKPVITTRCENPYDKRAVEREAGRQNLTYSLPLGLWDKAPQAEGIVGNTTFYGRGSLSLTFC